MGHHLDREVAMSHRNKDLETEAARQSHYIAWCAIIGIPDSCSPKYGYQCIVAIYIKYVMCGINYYNKEVLRSKTVQGYAFAVNALFCLQGYKQPTDLLDANNMPGIIINNLITQENIASQRAPLDDAIFAEIARAAKASHSLNSDQNLLFDILTLAQIRPDHPEQGLLSRISQRHESDQGVYPQRLCFLR
jgi:hypothetical protein